MTRKILVTGSREFDNVEVIRQALAEEYYRACDDVLDGMPADLIVIHGAAKGADSIADELATNSRFATVVKVPADWKNRPRWEAGPIRNAHMLDLGPDVVLAFYKNGAGNRGTQNCVNNAELRGIEVRKFYSD